MHTKIISSFIVLLSLAIVSVLSCLGCSEKQAQSGVSAVPTVSATPALLVTLPEDDKPPEKGAVTANQAPKGAIVDFFFSRTG